MRQGCLTRCVRDACFPGSALVPMPSLSSVGAASKYTKVGQLTLRERLARINTHTLSKKTTRLSQLLKQEAGLVPRVSSQGGGDGGRVASQPSQGAGLCSGWGRLRPFLEMRKLRLSG